MFAIWIYTVNGTIHAINRVPNKDEARTSVTNIINNGSWVNTDNKEVVIPPHQIARIEIFEILEEEL